MNDKNRHRSERNAYEKPDQNSFEKKNGHKKFHPTSSRGRVGLGLLATLPEKLQLGLRLWGFYPPPILISLWGPTGNLYDVAITFVLIFCAPGPRAAAPEYPSGCTFSLNHSTYLYLCKVKTVFCKSWRNSL